MRDWDENGSATAKAECIARTADAVLEGHRMAQGLSEKIAEMRDERAKQIAILDARMDGVDVRVKVLEEQVTGDLGIIKTLQSLRDSLAEIRDSMNKQSWLLPLATAIITAVAVSLIVKFI